MLHDVLREDHRNGHIGEGPREDIPIVNDIHSGQFLNVHIQKPLLWIVAAANVELDEAPLTLL